LLPEFHRSGRTSHRDADPFSRTRRVRQIQDEPESRAEFFSFRHRRPHQRHGLHIEKARAIGLSCARDDNPLPLDGSRLIVFAHGAGASSASGWMRAWAARLSALGTTIAFDYPYMRAGRKMPDPLPELIGAHRRAIDGARATHDGDVVLAGKSMGGRVGCHVALEEPSVKALVCFGYPMISPGKRSTVRDAVLLELRIPVLFVQGTRDPLCPLDRLQDVRGRMRAPSHLHVVEGGDHSLIVARSTLKSGGMTKADVDGQVLAAVKQFLDR
jgi:predicted alpha/beta-hydrolase family hydrolase